MDPSPGKREEQSHPCEFPRCEFPTIGNHSQKQMICWAAGREQFPSNVEMLVNSQTLTRRQGALHTTTTPGPPPQHLDEGLGGKDLP